MPETRTSIPRIRAVRFKAGGEVRLLKSSREKNAADAFADLKGITDWYANPDAYGDDLAERDAVDVVNRALGHPKEDA